MDGRVTINTNFPGLQVHHPNGGTGPGRPPGRFHTQSLFVNTEGRVALACPYQRGDVHRAFTFELVAWLLEVGSGNSPEGIVSHAELDPTSKRWAETSWYNDFRYEISVSFQRLCFFFCHHICQSPLNIPSLFLFFKKLKWPWRES